MARDELKQPLYRRSLRERLWARRPSLLSVAAVLVATSFLGGGAYLSRIPHPFAGEPVIVAAIPPPEQLKSVADQPDGAPSDEGADVETASVDDEKIDESPVEEPVTSQEVIVQSAVNRPLRPAPAPTLTEMGNTGVLPRIGPGNQKPSNVYAREVSLSVIHSDAPKIAIMLGGMGLNAGLTEKAMKELPGDVTFAFAPYGENLQEQVDKARANGHEVMLQLPMEPMGYPANNPGPKTLLAEAPLDDNIASLRWHMSRFQGYTGITNYLGARMLGSASALKPVLSEVQKRGLLYLEDNSAALTASQDIAKQIKLPLRRGELVIDADPNRDSIMAALELLEAQARSNGAAIGTGSGLAITTDTVKEWAAGLRERGFILVPVSAVYKGRLG
jgi:uncharacterized protein